MRVQLEKQVAIELLQHHLDYDADSGRVVWRNLSGARKDRNGLKAGSLRKDGYLKIQFRGRELLLHRVCWALANGTWPSQFIDHKNGYRADNRLLNLREATYLENAQNLSAQTGTRLGATGVAPSGTKFWAHITKDKKRHYLGTFSSIELAIEARESAEIKLFTHRRAF